MKSAALSLAALQDVVGSFPEDGLTASRRTALEQLMQSGLPSTREEDWKYTDLGSAIDTANRWLAAGAAPAATAPVDEPTRSIDADWILINSGEPSVVTGIDGVTVTTLGGSPAEIAPSGRLGDLNLALLRDALRISVADGIELNRPIGILVSDTAGTGPSVSQTRVDIDVGANSRVDFIEYHVSAGDDDVYTNSAVNLVIGDSARVGFVRIQERDRRHDQTGYTSASVGRDAEFRHCAFDIGGRLVRNDVVIDIAHPGSHTEFSGLYLVGTDQHIDNHTRADHKVGPAVSRQEYRGILTGRARGVWNGKAIVHEGADGTDAEQSNHNLLLSKNAEIDAKPELEIYTDDVKCSHGTTVGQLDETALFYLRSRGLNRNEARQLLTRAFAQSIVSKSPIESLHELLTDKIAGRLDELMQETDA